MAEQKTADGSEQSADPAATALALTRQFLAELRPGGRSEVRLDSDFERDLGLDSLCRVELAVRFERAFGIRLPEAALGNVASLRELLAVLPSSPAAALPTHQTAAAGLDSVIPRDAAADATAERVPDTATTLLEVLDWHVGAHPDRVQIIYLSEAGEVPITYRQLHHEANRLAAGLQHAGLEAGQTVAIMLPTGPDYFATYFGILRAGGVPVPIYPPARLSQIEEHVRRHAGILANAQATMLVTVPEARTVARLLEARVVGLRRVLTVDPLGAAVEPPLPVLVRGGDTAFIQYTSGSTGDPKGVVLSHANLLANIRAIGATVAVRDDDVFVSWLPLYHDMGLICAWLTSLYFGRPLVVMSPLSFLARPERWLQAISQYRGTISAAPNFAYELCLKRIDEPALAGLDLSCWRIAANGAEPVMPDTLRRFGDFFARCGLAAGALTPVYGLAENTVGLLCPPLGRGPRIDRVARRSFSAAGRAEPAAADDATALRFVSCGYPVAGHEVRIVDAAGQEVGERREGRLQFRGPSATAGYFRHPEATRLLFDGDWLNSGDRAYRAEGEVYLTGRVKDIIIRGGRNIYPHEVEDAVGGVSGVRRGCVAVFGSADPASGTERLVVLAETRIDQAGERDALRQRIVEITVQALGEPPDEVVLAPPGSVLKTSSGKIRRAACRELYESGRIGRRAAVWSQLLRLTAGAFWPAARGWLLAAGQRLFGVYARGLFLLLAGPTVGLTLLAPNPAAAWKINRLMARLLARLSATPLTVHGLEHLPAGPCMVVANHGSYLDGLALIAALPMPLAFVAKREFQNHWLASRYLGALGVVFIERFDPRQSLDAAAGLGDLLVAGRSLATFPEGTFRRAAGLLPFRLGAFAAAVSAGVPVLPVAIRGARDILRDGQRWPSRGAVVVTIGAPLWPPADAPDAFAATLVLRNDARRHMLAYCGEPDAETH